uniref:Invertebrate defensins family profile domain-containing protein n=1 Tax=Panagrolaimus sp. PS1159 TaxID=55785 RepID=A0AC35FMS5_9BILA
MKAAIICLLFIFAVVLTQTNAACTPGTREGVGWFPFCPLNPMECHRHCLSLNNGYTSGACNWADCTCKC